MKYSRTAISVVTAAAFGLSGGAVATPVFAATATPGSLYLPEASAPLCGNNGTLPATLWTGAGGTGTGYNSSSSAITAVTGDTLTIYNECSITVYFTGGVSNTAQWVSIAAGGSAVVTILDDTSMMNLKEGTAVVDSVVGSFRVTGGGASPSPSPSGGSASGGAPDPLGQAFGKPATGTCDDAASNDLNWSGVSSGGWSESWGRWEGYEGPVCTRTLVYSNALAKWTVS